MHALKLLAAIPALGIAIYIVLEFITAFSKEA
jgi:hypothetical protein